MARFRRKVQCSLTSSFLLIVELLPVNGQETQALRLVDSRAALYGSGMVLLHVGSTYHVLVGFFFPSCCSHLRECRDRTMDVAPSSVLFARQGVEMLFKVCLFCNCSAELNTFSQMFMKTATGVGGFLL